MSKTLFPLEEDSIVAVVTAVVLFGSTNPQHSTTVHLKSFELARQLFIKVSQ
jgi:hypothetical protein